MGKELWGEEEGARQVMGGPSGGGGWWRPAGIVSWESFGRAVHGLRVHRFGGGWQAT